MKKVIAILILVAFLAIIILSITGCNRQVIDTNWRFTEAHIILGDDIERIEIRSWRDFENSDMIQITTTDGVTMLTHSSNIILIAD